MMAFGIWGQVHGADTKPARVAVLWVIAALAHDLVLAPLIVAGGWVLRRAVRGKARASLQGTIVVVGVLVLVAVPALGGFGRRSDNPSVLPLDYLSGLLLACGVVALGGAVHLVMHRRKKVS